MRTLLRLVMTVLLVCAVAAGGLAWRLAQGPIEIGWLAQRLERVAETRFHQRLVIGHAALAWVGFSQGIDSPLDIRLAAVALLDEAGHPVAEVPQVAVSLSAGRLVLGQIVLRALELDGLRLRADRQQDGTVRIDFGGADEGATAPTGGAGLVPPLIHALALPPEGDQGSRASAWAQVQSLRVRGAALSVRDQQLGATWQASGVDLHVVRLPAGGAQGEAELTLSIGEQQVHASLSGTLAAGSEAVAVQARLSPVNPAQMAGLAPGLEALRSLDAPVALSASASVGSDLAPTDVAVQARVGAGRFVIGGQEISLGGAILEAQGNLTQGQVRVARLELAPRADGPRTVLRGEIRGRRSGGKIDADLSLEVDQIGFADLAAVWPVWLGGPGLQPWITGNITAGTARNAKVALHLTAPEDFSDADVTALSGGLDGEDLTVSWLRPVPPLEHGNARLNFLSPEELEIVVSGARQAGGSQGGLAVQNGRIRITGLNVHDQFMTIDADLGGPVADLVTLLRHPRLKLMDKRPIDLRDPAGNVTGHVAVIRLPLKHDLSVDEVRIQSTGHLTRLHLSGVAVGRDLDKGELDFDTGNDGLKLQGTADLARIPTQLRVELDFRNGAAAQILQRVTVSGKADAGQLAGAGVSVGDVLGGGSVGLQIVALSRRDSRGEVTVRADLQAAQLDLARLNFQKASGKSANAELHLVLDHDKIVAIDRVRADGENLSLAGSVRFGGGQAQALHLDRLRLGKATDLSGDIEIPHRADEPWNARLKGHSIDASAQFRHDKTAPQASQEDQPGPPWKLTAAFDQVVLGDNGRELNEVAVDAENDGTVTRRGVLTGRTGAGVPFRIEIGSQHGVRGLSGNTDDAGGLLWASGLVDGMRGGKLSLKGTYDDRAPRHPLQGTAEITDFRMQNAPALAKLLQVMTLYGLVDALQGPGMGISRLTAPFRMSGDVLELTDARAFSPSLGMTAKGKIDLARQEMAVEGTIVPAYFFNTLLGEIPLIGRLFSPEQGGGLFAATYRIHGSLDDPSVSVNPLAALTPGFLRGLFGIFDGIPGNGTAAPPAGPAGGGGN